jgi:hypothetical protein
MSDKQQNTQSTKGTKDVLIAAAKAIGSAAGTVASVAGVHGETTAAAAPKASGKLPKKNKSRLPRRVKKAQAHAHNKA